MIFQKQTKETVASSTANEKKERYQKTSESDTENDPPTVTITITQDDGINIDDDDEDKSKKRRKGSWATKMERRRRKGLPAMSSEIDYTNDEMVNGHLDAYVRQKRHSWWNIFVPDNLKNR